jgi:hypothetical protein
MEQEVVESSPTTTIIYQDMSVGESQSATSTIKALLELQQQTTGERETRTHLSKPCCCLWIVIRHTNNLVFLIIMSIRTVTKTNIKKTLLAT